MFYVLILMEISLWKVSIFSFSMNLSIFISFLNKINKPFKLNSGNLIIWFNKSCSANKIYFKKLIFYALILMEISLWKVSIFSFSMNLSIFISFLNKINKPFKLNSGNLIIWFNKSCSANKIYFKKLIFYVLILMEISLWKVSIFSFSMNLSIFISFLNKINKPFKLNSGNLIIWFNKSCSANKIYFKKLIFYVLILMEISLWKVSIFSFSMNLSIFISFLNKINKPFKLNSGNLIIWFNKSCSANKIYFKKLIFYVLILMEISLWKVSIFSFSMNLSIFISFLNKINKPFKLNSGNLIIWFNKSCSANKIYFKKLIFYVLILMEISLWKVSIFSFSMNLSIFISFLNKINKPFKLNSGNLIIWSKNFIKFNIDIYF